MVFDIRLYQGIYGRKAEFREKLRTYLGNYFYRCPNCGLTDGKIASIKKRDGSYCAIIVCKSCGLYLDTVWEGEV